MKPTDAETAIDLNSMSSWRAELIDGGAWLLILLVMWAIAR